MLDHVLGRPSAKSRRRQVLAVLAVWSVYLLRGPAHGPPAVRALSRRLSRRLTAWQAVALTVLYLYAARNFSTLVGLGSPDPLANMYQPAFFRATWVLTALDAGFWTAMSVRPRWLRDLASLLFSGFYLVAAEQADDKVRKVRGRLTVDHLRVSWNKSTSPYLRAIQTLVRPRRWRLTTRWPPRLVRIPRPPTSDYARRGGAGGPEGTDGTFSSSSSSSSSSSYIRAWLYYDGSLAHLRASGIHQVVLDVPGGGFVAMDPRCSDDRLGAWAVQTGLPVLSLDYRKAPEYPFPYALNECYDAYATLVRTRGRCIGLAARQPVRVVVTGDSAGGNLATAMTLMLLRQRFPEQQQQQKQKQQRPNLPLPDGLILSYPSLDVNIGNWMSDEQMALMRDRRMRATNRDVVRRKSAQYSDIAGTPHESEDENLTMTSIPAKKPKTRRAPATRDERTEKKGDTGEGQEEQEDDNDSDTATTALYADEGARTPQPAFSHVNIVSYGAQNGHIPVDATAAAVTAAAAIDADAAPDDTAASADADITDATPTASYHPAALGTRLATASTISYFNDRVLTPEMMRAMILLYVGPHNRPDFAQDYLLSPLLAPDLLLAQFPKTYFLTGERDPLVDDTVLFAGRLRRAKAAYRRHRRRADNGFGNDAGDAENDDDDDSDRAVAEVVLIPGVSHGFLQFPSLYPPAWQWIERTAEWIADAFQQADAARARRRDVPPPAATTTATITAEANGTASVVSKRGRKSTRDAAAPPASTSRAAPRPAGTLPPLSVPAAPASTPTSDSMVTPLGPPRRPSATRTESSGDEEGSPLEMMRMTKVKGGSVARYKTAQSGGTKEGAPTETAVAVARPPAEAATTLPTAKDKTVQGNGSSSAKNGKNGAKAAAKTTRTGDDSSRLERLRSSDDLLGRRMQGIVGGLTGLSEE